MRYKDCAHANNVLSVLVSKHAPACDFKVILVASYALVVATACSRERGEIRDWREHVESGAIRLAEECDLAAS
jgi:hypothetical protein